VTLKKHVKRLIRFVVIGAVLLGLPHNVYPKNNQDTAEAIHPLGKPAVGLLIWENDEEFLKLCAVYRTNIRMAAFQTTLPDPLPGEEFNVGLAAKILAGTVVSPGKIFSLNGILGPRTKGRGFRLGPAYSGSKVIWVTGGGICKISTTLYNTAVLANLDIVERWPHGMLVPYVPPGQDATVSYGARDFKFRNSTARPILIWAEKVGNTLFVAFYGRSIPAKVTWHHQTIRRQEPYVIRKYNRRLHPGEKKLLQSGAAGILVKNWLTIRNGDGTTKTKNLGTDYYTPMPEVIEFCF
jgi:vancomycin resistance protein VanW